MTKIKGTAENWESGQLGASLEHAVRVSSDEARTVEEAAGQCMQLISMRMPRELLAVLKEIAAYRGVGYQPMIRDLLQRWANGEIRTILEERLAHAKRQSDDCDKTAPLAEPLKKRA